MPLNINVVCCEDLLSALRMTDISGPARTGGRTTAHTEEYTICHLLSTLATHNHLRFPLTVSSRDRPDVFIEAGGVGIGIEITESIPEQFASLCALAEKEFPDTWLPVDHFPWDAPPLTKKQTRSLLTTKAVVPSGWLSNEPEREWAHFMRRVIDTKLSKLVHPDFARFDQNWLSIYDNMPLPNVHLADASAILRPLLEEHWGGCPSFDKVFIERGPVIAAITSSASEHLVVSDLWSTPAHRPRLAAFRSRQGIGSFGLPLQEHERSVDRPVRQSGRLSSVATYGCAAR